MSRNISGGLKGRNKFTARPVSPLQGEDGWVATSTWGFTPGCNIAGFQPRSGPNELQDENVFFQQKRAEGAEQFGSTVLCYLRGLLFGCPRSFLHARNRRHSSSIIPCLRPHAFTALTVCRQSCISSASSGVDFVIARTPGFAVKKSFSRWRWA